MTRKDYEAIAAAIKDARQIAGAPHNDALREVADKLAQHCAADNPRFDRARFMKACGVNNA